MGLSRNKTVRSAMKSYSAVGRAIQSAGTPKRRRPRFRRDMPPPVPFPEYIEEGPTRKYNT